MSPLKHDWIGEMFEFKCPNCDKLLTVKLISEEVIDEETGENRTKIIDEQCECGMHLEIFGYNN